jgi:Gas vesicle protein K
VKASKPQKKTKPKPKPKAAPKPQTQTRIRKPARATRGAVALQAVDLETLRQQIDARIAEAMPARWNPDPDEVRRSVMKLVLTIVEFVRQLLERQAVRRMEAETLTPEQIEAVGLALMRLEEAVRDLAKQSGLDPTELNLDLGPLGRLL